jgi:hypothetical protein
MIMRRRFSPIRRAAFLLLLVACGSRTGLFVDDSSVVLGPDAGGGHGIGVGSASDAAAEADVVSTLDARPPTDVNRTDCPDADALLVYTITDTGSLQSFDPSSGQFRNIGRIACPTNNDSSPFSMAVDRKGAAYVLFRDGNLFRVSTASGACIATSYKPGQSGFRLFGMGFTTNAAGPTETLYVTGSQLSDDLGNQGVRGVARIDTTTFELSVVTDFPTVDEAELTGTGDGRLYAFYRKGVTDPNNDFNGGPPPSYIGQLDTASGQVLGERRFDTVGQGFAWAFAFWGGDFYMFTQRDRESGSTVTRWRPSDDTVSDVASNPEPIVGAGVSTCAPQQ